MKKIYICFILGLFFNELHSQCIHTKAACNTTYSDMQYAVAKVNLPGAAYSFSGFLINNTNNDGRLLFLTTNLPFSASCYSPGSFSFNNATFTWNEDYTSCSGSAPTAVTSKGATMLASDGYISLLELHEPPNLPELTYLGWDITTAPSSVCCIFQSEFNDVKKGIVTSGSTSIQSLNIQCNENFNEANGFTKFLKLNHWNETKLWRRGRGAPLIMNNKKVAAVYVIGNDQNDCDTTVSSYFYDIALAANTPLFSYLRSSSNQTNSATIRRAYCKTSENLSGMLSENKIYQVSNTIVSTQQTFDGYTVRYQAGTYIELNNGFVSGTDFVAEINPCSNDVTIIAAKTDDNNQANREIFNHLILPKEEWLKIYPTLLQSGNAITIEADKPIDDIELQIFNLHGKYIRTYRLSGFGGNTKVSLSTIDMPTGMYVFKVRGKANYFTQKIIIQ